VHLGLFLDMVELLKQMLSQRLQRKELGSAAWGSVKEVSEKGQIYNIPGIAWCAFVNGKPITSLLKLLYSCWPCWCFLLLRGATLHLLLLLSGSFCVKKSRLGPAAAFLHDVASTIFWKLFRILLRPSPLP
jgi:hypothetical protein